MLVAHRVSLNSRSFDQLQTCPLFGTILLKRMSSVYLQVNCWNILKECLKGNEPRKLFLSVCILFIVVCGWFSLWFTILSPHFSFYLWYYSKVIWHDLSLLSVLSDKLKIFCIWPFLSKRELLLLKNCIWNQYPQVYLNYYVLLKQK